MLAFLLVLALKTIQDNLGQVFTPNTCLLRTTSTSAVIAVLYGGSAGTSLMALKKCFKTFKILRVVIGRSFGFILGLSILPFLIDLWVFGKIQSK